MTTVKIGSGSVITRNDDMGMSRRGREGIGAGREGTGEGGG